MILAIHKPSLPMHNETIIEAKQNSENEILILISNESGLKGYFLEATAAEVFEASFGYHPGFRSFKDCLTEDDYKTFVLTRRDKWEEEK